MMELDALLTSALLASALGTLKNSEAYARGDRVHETLQLERRPVADAWTFASPMRGLACHA